MREGIHPSSIVEDGARLGDGVRIGPFCHVGPDVVLGDGCQLICHYGAGRITRFAPDGGVEYVVPMPTPLVTKCAFGGDDLTTLYVTTCLRGRDPTIEPMAGHLYQVETDFRGIPANLWKLSPS